MLTRKKLANQKARQPAENATDVAGKRTDGYAVRLSTGQSRPESTRSATNAPRSILAARRRESIHPAEPPRDCRRARDRHKREGPPSSAPKRHRARHRAFAYFLRRRDAGRIAGHDIIQPSLVAHFFRNDLMPSGCAHKFASRSTFPSFHDFPRAHTHFSVCPVEMESGKRTTDFSTMIFH